MDRWIDNLAQLGGVDRLVLLRRVRTRTLLARAVAECVVASAQIKGDEAFETDARPPDGDTLDMRIARAQYDRRMRAAQAEWVRRTTPDPDEAARTALAMAALRGTHGRE